MTEPKRSFSRLGVFVPSICLLSSAGNADEPFRAGVIIPLSGPLAQYGVAIRNGFELAREERPAEFAKCKISIEDSQYVSAQALSAFRKLTTIDTVSLIYLFGGPLGEALAPVAEEKKVPLITDTNDPKVSEGREYVSRYANERREVAGSLVPYLVAKGIKKVSVVSAENQYLHQMVLGFREEAEGKIEIETVAEVLPDDTDMRPLATKIVQRKPAALGAFLMPGQLSTLARLLSAQLQERPVLFGGDFLENPVEIEASNGYLVGAVYPNNLVKPDFRERYSKRFSEGAQLKFAAEGFDVANLIADRLCPSGGGLERAKVIEALYATPPREGAQGLTVFKRTPKGDKYFAAPITVMEVTKDGFVPARP